VTERTDDLRAQIQEALSSGVTAAEVWDILDQVELHIDTGLDEFRIVLAQVLEMPEPHHPTEPQE
jgi:hypothetical protein